MQVVIQGIVSVLGIFATWYLGRFLVRWLQAYRNRQAVDELAKLRADTQAKDQAAQAESDKLKDIDGR